MCKYIFIYGIPASAVHVAQSCPTLCDPVDYTVHGILQARILECSIHGILQAGILEWIAISSSRGPSRPKDRTQICYVSCIAGRFFTN